MARVLIESSLPHLDRPFDYSVPADLDAAAQPGVRVKVKFNGQELAGYLLERIAESDAGHALVPLHKVVSPVPVLTPAVAGPRRPRRRPLRRNRQRCPAGRRAAAGGEAGEGIRSLRCAWTDLFAADRPGNGGSGPPLRGRAAGRLGAYRNGPAFLQHLARGSPPGPS